MPSESNRIYLTFDDGPTPDVTDFVLKELATRNLRATFFCLGRNLEQNQTLAVRLIDEGHQLANHGYDHLDGWKISKISYRENIEKGESEIRKLIPGSKPKFRPPYGHTRSFGNEVMWTLMSGDFDLRLSSEKCLNKLMKETRSGDVVLFHDNLKSFATLQWVLPRYLDFCIDQGFEFASINWEYD